MTFAGTEFSVAGLQFSDAVTSVTLTSAGAPAGAPMGTYPIIATAAVGTGLTNYIITYIAGTLSLNYVTLGFFSPVANLPTVNSAQAGQAVVLKWELWNALGQNVSSVAAVTSIRYRQVACAAETISC